MNNEYLTIKEAAALVEKSELTIRRAIKANHVLASRKETKSGFNYVISRESLLIHFGKEGLHDQPLEHPSKDSEQSSEREAQGLSTHQTKKRGQTKGVSPNQPNQNDDTTSFSKMFSNLHGYFDFVIKPYKETIQTLKEEMSKKDEQLKVKDTQLGAKDIQLESLIERTREMNHIIAALQEKLALPKPEERQGAPGQVVEVEPEAEPEPEPEPEIVPVPEAEETKPKEPVLATIEVEQPAEPEQPQVEQAPAEQPQEEAPKKKGLWRRFWGL
jgi:hypothetical protein